MVASNSVLVPSKKGFGGMKKTKSIHTCWWLLLNGDNLKLLAKEVLVPDIEAAEDLNLRPVATSFAAFRPRSPLLASDQPQDVTLRLI